MANGRRVNPVYRSISAPLTILGAERKLFFFAMCIGAGTFNLLGSLLGGVLMFLLLYFVVRWATETDPQILRLGPTSPRHAIFSFSIVPLVYATSLIHKSLPLTTNGTVPESLGAPLAFRLAPAAPETVS